MKILVVHNFYAQIAPSGENKVVEDEIAMLKQFGNEVNTFFTNNNLIRNSGFFGKLIASLSYLFNIASLLKFKKTVKDFKPDIIHVHNIFPLISPSIFYFKKKNIPIFYTLHTYRLFCPNALPYRAGEICTKCMDSNSILPSLLYKCYRNSFFATLPISMNVFIYNILLSTWKKKIDGFIVFSDFQKNMVSNSGITKNKIYVKPNFTRPKLEKIDWHNRSNYLVYVGRLSHEKGIKTLIQAWELWGLDAPELRIIGDGILFNDLKTKSNNLNINFLGNLDALNVQRQISKSKLLIIPSECIEGCPLSLLEAFSYGTPVAVSDLGPLPQFIQNGNNGVIFKQKNAQSLINTVNNLFNDEIRLQKLSDNCYNSYLNYFEIISNYKQLIKIYNSNSCHEQI